MLKTKYRNRINELANKINDETQYEVIITTAKEMIELSIHTIPYKANSAWESEHYNLVSLTHDTAETLENVITVLETYYRRGLKESRVTA